MSTLSLCWIDGRTFSAGDTMTLTEALDVGEYNTLEVVVTVNASGAGDSPMIVLQHAARNEVDAYVDFSTAISVDLLVEGKSWFHVDRFTRFLGWSLSGTLESSATITLDIVAKR